MCASAAAGTGSSTISAGAAESTEPLLGDEHTVKFTGRQKDIWGAAANSSSLETAISARTSLLKRGTG